MAGFSSRADLIDEAFTNGKRSRYEFVKTSSAPETAGVLHSLWTAAGMPAAGAAPAGTPGAAYDSDPTTHVAGAIDFDDTGSDQKHLLSISAMASVSCNLILYDRLCGVGGVSTTTTGAKTVNSAALTRYTGTAAVENEVWLEVSTATTVTAPVVNLNQYTSADGSTGQAGGSVTFPAAATNADTLIMMPLDASKKGVRSVEVGLNIGTASTAGAVSVLIVRRLATIPLIANTWAEVSFLDDVMALDRIYDNACLGLALQVTGTTAVALNGTITVASG